MIAPADTNEIVGHEIALRRGRAQPGQERLLELRVGRGLARRLQRSLTGLSPRERPRFEPSPAPDPWVAFRRIEREVVEATSSVAA